MPVTAKLSRNFYERLGDDIASELVDWFNTVDEEYRRQYREANDLNWERFKAFHRAELTEFRREVDSSIARTEAGLRADFNKLRSDVGDFRSEIMKWMFIYWSGTIVTLGGLITVLWRTGP